MMRTIQVAGRRVAVHAYHTLIVGAGAAGMNAAVHLHDFLAARGVSEPGRRLAVVAAGIGLGASRMSGSDKQTYYKLGTSPAAADSAEDLARSLTAAGCVHADLAMAEAAGSPREFYHLVEAGVPFPHDRLGSYVGYKTDNDPRERATSAGPKTSRFMSERLQAQVEGRGIAVFDRQEAARLVVSDGPSGAAPPNSPRDAAPNDGGARSTGGPAQSNRGAAQANDGAAQANGGGAGPRRIVALIAVDTSRLSKDDLGLTAFLLENLILAAGGPGEMYEATVYPAGQFGMHGLALGAGLEAENLTESQFGLASIRFRWNVSGTYMQVIPRIFSTDAAGDDPRDFLAEFFPTMRLMAGRIFLKGYQWPLDPDRIAGFGSSLIDVLVHRERERGRRVFLDFRENPRGGAGAAGFDLADLEPEAARYLEAADAPARPTVRERRRLSRTAECFIESPYSQWGPIQRVMTPRQ